MWHPGWEGVLGRMDTRMEVKNPPANAEDLGDVGSIPGLGRSPGGGNENRSGILAWRIPNPMDRGAWQATVHRATQSLKQLSMARHGGLLGCEVVKNPPANTGDTRDAGSIPGLGRSPGGGNGNPLQYSCLENSIEPGGLQSIRSKRVGHGWVTESAHEHRYRYGWVPSLFT